MKKVNPHKAMLWFVLILLYAVLTYRILFVSVPAMLREADTLVNTLGFVAAVCWIAITVYIAVLLVNRKTLTKGN